MKTLDRYVLRQIQVPFLFALGLVVLLVFLLHSRRLAEAVLGLGLSPSDGLIIFLAALPPFLVIVIPLAYMTSVMIGLGRLSGERELLALGAAGASPLRIARVPILLGLAITFVAMPIAHYAAPFGMELLYARVIDIGIRNMSQAIQPGIFNETLPSVALYARAQREDGLLSDVMVFDDRDPLHPALIVADSGRLQPVQRDLVLDLNDGEIHLTRDEVYDRARFERAEIGLDIQEQLDQRTQFLSASQRMTSGEMVATYRRLGRGDLFSRRTERDFWRRFAHPLMAVIFGMIATAITLNGRPRRHARNVILALLSVVVYYLLGRVADLMITHDTVAPAIAVFGSDAVMLVVGIAGLLRAGVPR